MSYRNCDTIFTESQETNKNLNLSTPPIKKIFQSNEIAFPQTFHQSNFQYNSINKKYFCMQFRTKILFKVLITELNWKYQQLSIKFIQNQFKQLKIRVCIIYHLQSQYDKELYFKFKYHIQNINLIKFILLIKFYYRIEEIKPCNCKKSKCLKLYCDCFAAGKLCSSKCNCCGCFNNSSNLVERNQFIEKMVERNPEAFIQKVKEVDYKLAHSKGCNCRKSGCKKKYCECYQLGIECSDNCKCDGCQNCSQNKLVKIFTQQDISQFSRQLKQLSQPF